MSAAARVSAVRRVASAASNASSARVAARFLATQPPSEFVGRRVLVTGSTSGIGAAVARAFAARGASVMISGFGPPAEIAALQKELISLGAPVVGFDGADLSKPEEVERLVATTVATLGGPIHTLVNNAGIQHTSPIATFPTEQWNRVIAINLSAVFLATRAVLPQMYSQGAGRIVNIASVHGLVGSMEKSAYVAAKHGVIGLTKVTGLELAASHRGAITCNAVCPGWVRTELVEKQIDALAAKQGLDKETAAEELLKAKQPSRAFVQPSHLADAVCFFASDAAAQINGTSLAVDGGWTAQ